MVRNEKDKLWTLPFILLFVLSIITTFSFNMSMPILPVYAVKLGATLTIAGTLSGMFAITALVVRPFSGVIADKFNNKFILAVSIFITALAMFGYFLAQNLSVLFIFRIIHGASFGISSTVNVTLASKLIPKERLGEGLSLYGIAQIASMAVGPSVGLSISQNIGYSYCFLFSGLILLTALLFLVMFRATPEPKKQKNNQGKRYSIQNFIATESIIFASIGGCFSMINGMISTYLVLYGNSLGIKGVGLYFTVNAIALVLSRLFVGRMMDQTDLRIILFPSLGAGIIAVLIMGYANSLGFILLAAVFYALGQGTGQSAIQAACIKQVGEERRGVAISTFFLGADVGQGIGPMIGGVISQQFGYKSMYYFGVIPLIIGILLFVFHLKYTGKKQTVQRKNLSKDMV